MLFYGGPGHVRDTSRMRTPLPKNENTTPRRVMSFLYVIKIRSTNQVLDKCHVKGTPKLVFFMEQTKKQSCQGHVKGSPDMLGTAASWGGEY